METKKNSNRSEDALQKLHSKLNEATKNNIELARDIVYEKGKRRKPSTVQFLGREYCLLMSHFGIMNFNETEKKVNGGTILPILIPKNGFDALPDGEMFSARILGVVHFNPKPIYKNFGPSPILIAAAFSIGMIPKQQFNP
ncbi:MAG: hypothetical protein COV01_00410 [Candidatus Taylorbacteria bacterium CG10_big_fil_rev_8_21_14_0_10_41_48]|uniref:Uncharacterized protein n=1 Tax=Candidatus Taylorbacteria bacterium CG10_big_fil_rev_8_21_14_0_10_41_48 TaxID=1975024 RepID=A0A2M8LCY9_9BACT|nr:MAG: hypothetical protein COV01_00410 [Candidatus Taylorbacteria bacterium CG10_big_fil_rev_8_21_14_0_10_41_48]